MLQVCDLLAPVNLILKRCDKSVLIDLYGISLCICPCLCLCPPLNPNPLSLRVCLSISPSLAPLHLICLYLPLSLSVSLYLARALSLPPDLSLSLSVFPSLSVSLSLSLYLSFPLPPLSPPYSHLEACADRYPIRPGNANAAELPIHLILPSKDSVRHRPRIAGVQQCHVDV